MEQEIRAFFARYEAFVNRGLDGTIDFTEGAALYASDFIAATPRGVLSGKNDDSLKAAMERGYQHYRQIGTREMRVRDIRITPIDALHCLAHVDWRSVYVRESEPDVTIDFTVHYLTQNRDGTPKVFGWISGDEEALLKEHGIG